MDNMTTKSNNKISSEAIIQSTLNFDDFKNDCFKTKFKKGFIYFFTNMGLVASGKTTVSSMLESQIKNKVGESNVNFFTVSSDKLRMEIEKTMGNEKKQMPEDKFNEKVMKKTKKAFDDQLFSTLEKWEQDKFNFILLDKNFFVNTLSQLKKTIDRMYPSYKDFLEVICFIPKCETNLVPYELSLNYIIQSYYRLKNRKGHETLDFDITPNAHLIFLSFLTLFMKMKFSNSQDLRLFFYGLSVSDETEIDFDSNFDFVLNFNEIMAKIKASPFKIEILAEINNEILAVLEQMETKFPQDIFRDTRPKIAEEIKEFVDNKFEEN